MAECVINGGYCHCCEYSEEYFAERDEFMCNPLYHCKIGAEPCDFIGPPRLDPLIAFPDSDLPF